jgi:Fur family ferric uptake transcriptional regulator
MAMPHQKQQRNTQQRQIVLEELRKVTSHPTATELYKAVRERLPKISLGTVYRNLDLLSQLGEVQKLKSGGTKTRFDGNPEQHYHIRCLRCGSVGDAHRSPLDISTDGLQQSGYKVLGHRLEFIGVCPRCQNDDAEKTTDSMNNEEE